MLSRAVDDPKLSNEILEAARASLMSDAIGYRVLVFRIRLKQAAASGDLARRRGEFQRTCALEIQLPPPVNARACPFPPVPELPSGKT
jgi:hypothetical protein